MTITETALGLDFTYAKIIDAGKLTFQPEFRQCCEDNACGNYGRNYSCPPDCGTVEEMRERTLGYEHALVLCTVSHGVDAYNEAESKLLKKDHTQRTQMLIKQLKERELVPEKGLRILAGPCSLCPTCKILEQQPCPMEEVRGSCLSAYCINVTALAETAGIPISWEGDQVSFFSLYLWKS